jgi:hypothetical protein
MSQIDWEGLWDAKAPSIPEDITWDGHEFTIVIREHDHPTFRRVSPIIVNWTKQWQCKRCGLRLALPVSEEPPDISDLPSCTEQQIKSILEN